VVVVIISQDFRKELVPLPVALSILRPYAVNHEKAVFETNGHPAFT
jgi:hypothetical protein